MKVFTRRELVQRIAIGLIASPFIAACASPSAAKPDQAAEELTSEPSEPIAEPEQAAAEPPQEAPDCTDTEGLERNQILVRESLQYQDKSPRPGQNGANCQHFRPAGSSGECGGCAVVPGPISPKGWCAAWVSMA